MTKSELCNAFVNGKEGRSHNACTEVLRQPHMTSHHLYLHGNEIARIVNDKLILDDCGWPTATTQSYMNHVLSPCCSHYVSRSKGQMYIANKIPLEDVEYIDLSTGSIKIKEGGMKAYGYTSREFNAERSPYTSN